MEAPHQGPLENLATVAKALDPVASSPEAAAVYVRPATLEVLQNPPREEEEEPDWSADEEEFPVAQAIPAGQPEGDTPMSVEEHGKEEAPRRVSRPEMASSSSARAASVSRLGRLGGREKLPPRARGRSHLRCASARPTSSLSGKSLGPTPPTSRASKELLKGAMCRP